MFKLTKKYINKFILIGYMEYKSSFRLVFGESPIVKVIDFFLDNREFDYSLTDIAKNAVKSIQTSLAINQKRNSFRFF